MKQTDIQILGCKIGKKISANYYDNRDSHNYNVEDGEYPHPDLINAIKAFKSDLAEAHFILGEEQDNFRPSGFQVTEDKEKFFVKISGKMTTFHDDKVTINSGTIPIEEGDVEKKLKTLRGELYKFFFEGKSAQGDLFEGDKGKSESD